MSELESSLHLYQPSLFRGASNTWKKFFVDAVKDCGDKLTWDVSAIVSILSFDYSCGDRTLFKELRRSPWLSKIESDNSVSYEMPPEHNTLWLDKKEIASTLINLLTSEAQKVCQGREEIYLLLSGGLDSRIVAGILSKLYKKGLLSARPVAVTWGMENSRDVAYGRAAADMLGFDWQHVDLSLDTVKNNIEEMTLLSGGLVSPIHFHAMGWFKNVSKDALVLAGSYGDSIGRAEYSGKNILELDYLKPFNLFGLLRKDIFNVASKCLTNDLKQFHQRFGLKNKYILCEYEQQGHYMRGMIGHAMNVINDSCSLYQMFSDPEVYGCMWSIHPALRTNQIYAIAFEMLDYNLARLPWARTNRALSGPTSDASKLLRPEFHAYTQWISGPLFKMIDEYVDPDWFSRQIGFNKQAVDKLRYLVSGDPDGSSAFGRLPHEKWVWLASLRILDQHLKQLKVNVKGAVEYTETLNVSEDKHSLTFKALAKNLLIKIKPLYSLVKSCRNKLCKLRRLWLMHRAKYLYPPKYVQKNN